jgi:hypothetical protein
VYLRVSVLCCAVCRSGLADLTYRSIGHTSTTKSAERGTLKHQLFNNLGIGLENLMDEGEVAMGEVPHIGLCHRKEPLWTEVAPVSWMVSGRRVLFLGHSF